MVATLCYFLSRVKVFHELSIVTLTKRTWHHGSHGGYGDDHNEDASQEEDAADDQHPGPPSLPLWTQLSSSLSPLS